ncbi:hypothetical protein BACCAP_04201 [Pseudoflavonifractor capillosus ATCC 29799]|uniref:Uncharacterized protein n=1 Tax=Pseudoflavonifractor capillosus ATCC 29799 TaxID=411467 RepID=A6P135_9FIRM|nr:hypothetical protein BACCAP_04201 [Pseudoflavonifractor capillosus ATCC 29799]
MTHLRFFPPLDAAGLDTRRTSPGRRAHPFLSILA